MKEGWGEWASERQREETVEAVYRLNNQILGYRSSKKEKMLKSYFQVKSPDIEGTASIE